MNFSQAIQSVFVNYKNFASRAPRSEFWYWMLFTVIVQLVVLVPIVMVAMATSDVSMLVPFFIAACAVAVFIFLLTLNVSIRRLHDQGLNGWFYLLFLIPSVGWLIQLVMMLQPSQEGSNNWGPASPSK